MLRILEEALTFDDVLLVPGFAEVLPKDVDLKTQLTHTIQLNIPLLSAAMDTVTEARLAVALAELGGIGVLHKSMSIEAQAEEVRKVKKFESGVVNDPVTIAPDAPISEYLKLRETYRISGMPVVAGNQVVGIITSRDTRFETDYRQPVSAVMTPRERLITVPEGVDQDEVREIFRRHRVEKLIIINENFELRGMYTVRDLLKSQTNPDACKTESGQLRVAAAVGTSADTYDRVAALAAAKADLIVVDTAHGFSKGVVDMVKWVKTRYPDMQVMAGNIAAADAAIALAKAGADAVKVGMGPGSICTTRIVAGVGVPQITAISNVAQAMKRKGVPVVADGGIRFSGDLCKAIVAGASAVMIGGLLAGTEEAPGEVVLYQGRSYKAYRGMGSVGAMSMRHGSSDRYFQDDKSEVGKLVPEGIEGRVPYKGSLKNVVHQMTGGLRSSMGYTGTKSIQEMHDKASFVRVTNAGMRESHVHDVIITKEAPNYWVDKA